MALTAVVVGTLICALGVFASPGSTATAVTVPNTCTAAGPVIEHGSSLISHPMAPQITGASLAMEMPVSYDVTPTINPGGNADSFVDVQLDLAAVAQDVLANRVRPGIAAAGYPELAPTAWVVLDLSDVTMTFANPGGTIPAGTPTASASSTTASASWTADGVRLALDHLTADSRAATSETSATLGWQVVDGGAPAGRTIDRHPAELAFTAEVTVGVLFYGVPVTGSVSAPWSCAADDPGEVLASTVVTDEPVTTGTSMPASTTPTSGSSTTSTSTTTTWPSVTTTPTSTCAVSGFDRYGGYAGMTLGATGFFRTQEIDGRWWLIDPDGHPFFSQGINHVTFDGTPDRFGATPYHDAVVARYGTAQNWADAQLERMQQWGYNTLGAWSDVDLFAGRAPYTLLLDMTSQDPGTGEMQDLFDPAWAASVQGTANAAAAAHGDDPALLGYWSDNELHFGPDWRPLHLFDDYLARPAASPGKQALIVFLQDRYPTFSAFAADFTTTATDWGSLADPSVVTAWTQAGGEATRAAWVGEVAERYFSVTANAIHAADPNHLFLGPRFISQTTGTPVLEAAARHVDVASFNLYEIRPELIEPLKNADPTYLPVTDGLAAQAAILDKPILISEWSYRAADSGLPNTWPPLFPTLDTQAQRAAAYEKFVSTLLGTGWIVGQHWFEHADEPPAGRFDGEDSNFGLVDGNDDPYEPLVAISATMHDCAYARLLGDASSGTTATTSSETANTGSAVEPSSGNRAASIATRPVYTG